MASLEDNFDELLEFESSPKDRTWGTAEESFFKEMPDDFNYDDFLNENIGLDDLDCGFDIGSLEPLNGEQQTVSHEVDTQPVAPTPIPFSAAEKEPFNRRQTMVRCPGDNEEGQQASLKISAAQSFSNFGSVSKAPYQADSSTSTIQASLVSSNGHEHLAQSILNGPVSQVHPSSLVFSPQPHDTVDLDQRQVPNQVTKKPVGAERPNSELQFDGAEALGQFNASHKVFTESDASPGTYELPRDAYPMAVSEGFDNSAAYHKKELNLVDHLVQKLPYSNKDCYGQPQYRPCPLYAQPVIAQPPLYAHSGHTGHQKYELPHAPYPQTGGQQRDSACQQQYESPLLPANQRYELQETLSLSPQSEVEPTSLGRTCKTSKAAKTSGRMNKRSQNIKMFNPKEHYTALPEKPQSWGSINPNTNRPTFEYTSEGELMYSFKFTREQMHEYLTKHPCIDGPLRLWIQICPADSVARYPHKTYSHRCRFQECPISNNSIAVGEYRVALDEQSSKPFTLDPFRHMAGYVHLFCLEKNFDFPQLCKDFNVMPDTRIFFNEPKKFALNKDYASMEHVTNDFISNSKSWRGKRDHATYYPQTLCYSLTLESLKFEPRTRQAERDRRDGNSVDKHFNNLDIKAENEINKKEGQPWKIYERPTIKKPGMRPNRAGKRKSRSSDDDSAVVSPGFAPAAKKTKVMEQGNATYCPKKEPRSSRSSKRRSLRTIVAKTSSPSSKTAQRHEAAPTRSSFEPGRQHPGKRKASAEEYSDFNTGGCTKISKVSKPASKAITMPKMRQRLQASKGDSGDEYASSKAFMSTERRDRCPGYKSNTAAAIDFRTSPPVTSRKAVKQKAYAADEFGFEDICSPSRAAARITRLSKNGHSDYDNLQSFQLQVSDSLRKYGRKRKLKVDDTAGLTTPLGDMIHLPY